MRNKYLNLTQKRELRMNVPSFASGIDTVTDERILPLSKGDCSYNYSFSTGALKEGLGLDKVPIRGAKSVWQFLRTDENGAVKERILMYCSDGGKIYYLRGLSFHLLTGIVMTGRPFAVNYKLYGEDVIIICSPSDRMVVWNGTDEAYTIADSPLITSLCMHYERMFVTTSNQRAALWFSDDLDPTNWNPELDEGGFIELLDERGKLNKVLSFNNYVYVFRDYGITRLSAFANQSDFNAVNLFVSSGRIYADTVALCGDVIIFMATDGLYSFDGVTTRRILKNLDGMLVSGGNPTGCFFGGKYYVAFQANFKDGEVLEGNNCLLAFDRLLGHYDLLRGENITVLCPVADGSEEILYAVLKNGRVGSVVMSGKVIDDAITKKVWKSGLSDLGHANKTKHIKEVYIDSVYDCVLTVMTEKGSRAFAVKGKPSITRLRVNMRGLKVGLKIESDGIKADIARPTILYTLE